MSRNFQVEEYLENPKIDTVCKIWKIILLAWVESLLFLKQPTHLSVDREHFKCMSYLFFHPERTTLMNPFISFPSFIFLPNLEIGRPNCRICRPRTKFWQVEISALSLFFYFFVYLIIIWILFFTYFEIASQ